MLQNSDQSDGVVEWECRKCGFNNKGISLIDRFRPSEISVGLLNQCIPIYFSLEFVMCKVSSGQIYCDHDEHEKEKILWWLRSPSFRWQFLPYVCRSEFSLWRYGRFHERGKWGSRQRWHRLLHDVFIDDFSDIFNDSVIEVNQQIDRQISDHLDLIWFGELFAFW